MNYAMGQGGPIAQCQGQDISGPRYHLFLGPAAVARLQRCARVASKPVQRIESYAFALPEGTRQE
jgi:hypothetical protein